MRCKNLAALFIFLLISCSGLLYGQDATEIIRQMDEKMRGESLKAEMSMTPNIP